MPTELEIVENFDSKFFDKLIYLYENIENDCHFMSGILNVSYLNKDIKSEFIELILYSIKSNSIFKK